MQRAQLPRLDCKAAGTMGSTVAHHSNGRSAPASPVLTPSTSTTPFGEFGRSLSSSSEGEGDSSGGHARAEYFELSRSRSRKSLSRSTSRSRNDGRAAGSGHGHGRSYSTSSNPRSACDDGTDSGQPILRPRSAGHHSRPASRNNFNSGSSYHVPRASSPLISSHRHHQSGSRNNHAEPSGALASGTKAPSSSYYQSLLSLGTSSTSSSSSLHSNTNPHHHSYHAAQHRTALSSAKALARLPPAAFARLKTFLGVGTGEWLDPISGRKRVPERLKAYVPLLIWVIVSVLMAVIVGVWHEQVFAGLDSLSTYLKSIGLLGDLILFFCIFITTFPPLPLYSTFIILSGYSFGLYEGFLISYAGALSGAVVVYGLSRVFLQSGMVGLLEKSKGLKKVVRAIERRPKLLWLIRLSPYPYNVMNVLLASSSTLSFSCYFWCTALALPKLIIHCAIGTTIRNFAESATSLPDATGPGSMLDPDQVAREAGGRRMKAIAGAVGLLLCVGVFVYILVVARRAVDDLDDADRLPSFDLYESEVPLGFRRCSGDGAYRALSEKEEVDYVDAAPLDEISVQGTSRPSGSARRPELQRDKKEMSQIDLTPFMTTNVRTRDVCLGVDTRFSDLTSGRGKSIDYARADPSRASPVHHRHVFERQNTSAALPVSGKKESAVVQHLEYQDSRQVDVGRHTDSSGPSWLVERLESAAGSRGS